MEGRSSLLSPVLLSQGARVQVSETVVVVNAELPRTCIIGAGSSGIAVAKTLQQNGLGIDVYEKSNRIGGNWVFRNSNGMSSAYRSLHINTSRDKMAYSDFPMPADYPDFPHHVEIAAYFDAYADHFGIRPAIQFETGVTKAEFTNDGLWRIVTDRGDVRHYDVLVVANGHHWDPRLPEPGYPGHFTGPAFHSHSYIDPKEPADCAGKNVLIVGFGNSALDLACELGRKGVAKSVFLSQRRGYWVIPKYFGAETLDQRTPHPSEDMSFWQRMLPRTWIRSRAEKLVAQTIGRPEDHGLPAPDHRLFSTHPAVSQELYIRIGSGDVIPKPDIKALEGDQVAFVDGSIEPIDVIIWCTGYRITFPFFDEGLLSAPNNDIALWQRMMDPRFNSLFFVGLVQPLCAMMPIAEEQSKFIASYLLGRYALPPFEQIERERIAMHEGIKRTYVDSPRHTIQINCADYARQLRLELQRGRLRADMHGNPLPIEARAEKLQLRAKAAETA